MSPSEIEDLFAAGGPLARAITDYSPRPQQLTMAQAVAHALEAAETLVVEAGTGTGKTFAYLVPALLSGQRVVISTGTLNLQDQLFRRDLPRVRDALGAPVRVSLLKGRANYLCLHRLKQAQHQPALRSEWPRLQALLNWSQETSNGEIQQAPLLRREDPLLPRVTSTAENCLGSRCADFEQCFVAKARQAAQAAEVVVINHHLLLSDFVLKEEGFGRILPGADAVIVDEAHQLPDAAEQFFGARLTSHQLDTLAQDCVTEAQVLRDVPDLADAAVMLSRASAQWAATFSALNGRLKFADYAARKSVPEALDGIFDALQSFNLVLKPLSERSVELDGLKNRGADLAIRLAAVTATDDAQIRWVEAQSRGGGMHATPLRLSEGFRRLRETQPGAWVFTSATLAVGENFSHFSAELGLGDAPCLRLESPFDFETQARLYLPSGLPEPNAPDFHERLFDTVLPLIRESRGGAFLLCTSHRALRLAAERLRRELTQPLYVQGEGDRAVLLEQFAADGNAVLIGTSSFWEGVDVRGSALRMVIIDRLPFTAPGDPVFEARLDALAKSGASPFMDYQLPQAIMTLRQGAGRLIRDASDQGLLVLCDPRLRSKSYGARVLASLPSMPILDEQADALRWLRKIRPA
ncbi:MAG: ATP-dependent DNA helicase [Pseudomonadota bacterium]